MNSMPIESTADPFGLFTVAFTVGVLAGAAVVAICRLVRAIL